MKTNNATKDKNPSSEPVKNTPSDAGKKKGKGAKINSLVRKIGVWMLIFLFGALVVGLTLYLPVNSKLREAEAEIERLRPIENAYEDLMPEFEQVSNQRSIYKLLANSSQMHMAIINERDIQVNRYITYIEDDLSNLTLIEFPDLPNSLQEQFSLVTKEISGNRTDAIEELQKFQNDLLVLIDNLE